MSRSVRIGLSLAISAVFLFFAARGVDWAEAARSLARVNYWYVVPMIAATVWTLYIRAQRWRVLLRPVGTPSMRNLVAATNIGFMANMVLPLRMGEVIRPVMLSRKENEPLGGILATIVLERVFDLLMVVLLFGVSATLVGVSDTLRQWGYRLCGIAVIMGGGVAFVRWQEALALRLLHAVLRPLPTKIAEPVEHFFGGFVKALEILDSPRTFLEIVSWSLFLWVVIVSVQASALLAFDLPVPLLLASIVVTAITAIAVSAPSAPGYIGAFQLGCTLALAIFSVQKDQAFAFSIVLHLSQFVAVIGAGLYSLAREGLSLKQLEEVSQSDASAA
jgi:uncharacterized protein (TIRG00374 family)